LESPLASGIQDLEDSVSLAINLAGKILSVSPAIIAVDDVSTVL